MGKSKSEIVVSIFNDTAIRFLPKLRIQQAVVHALKREKVRDAEINVVLLTDRKIHKMNRDFLSHDYATDCITFSLAENVEAKAVDGEIYISVDTARKQAKEFNVSLTNELMRLAVHGSLHLAGYDDGTEAERSKMNELETRYITPFSKRKL